MGDCLVGEHELSVVRSTLVMFKVELRLGWASEYFDDSSQNAMPVKLKERR